MHHFLGILFGIAFGFAAAVQAATVRVSLKTNQSLKNRYLLGGSVSGPDPLHFAPTLSILHRP
ncbi:MAG: hypothetical protein ACKO1M_10825 [Planctomycetota bacterium]